MFIIFKECDCDAKEILLYKGFCYDGLEKYDLSIEFYDKLLALEPDHEIAFKAKGDVFWFQNKKCDSLDMYNNAIRINSKCVTAYLNKAAILVEMNRGDEAMSCYDKLLEINPLSSIAFDRKRKLFYKLNKNLTKQHFKEGEGVKVLFIILI